MSTARYCMECGTTSTPQWREGPMGPKTLCNACGVRRQRLIRRQGSTKPTTSTVSTLSSTPSVDASGASSASTILVAPSIVADDPISPGVVQAEIVPISPTSTSQSAAPSNAFQHSDVDSSTSTSVVNDEVKSCDPPAKKLKPSLEIEDSSGFFNGEQSEEQMAAFDLMYLAGVRYFARQRAIRRMHSRNNSSSSVHVDDRLDFVESSYLSSGSPSHFACKPLLPPLSTCSTLELDESTSTSTVYSHDLSSCDESHEEESQVLRQPTFHRLAGSSPVGLPAITYATSGIRSSFQSIWSHPPAYGLGASLLKLECANNSYQAV
eukprot:CAMPEP_0175078756 /NCGR_PEP_ID=MMETSP0052_2-20121109/24345_1 /TAXON_ID=51329 ORGANISM="Polytomella parva, Strain SAG 63-3" /NCGR_SAMPLE_ID=MMETSP0052_2 /ASSEMBLY_ACC=CAM_ASM_000194 /LENGTH=321 /DNA_ID=CAMNT_0016348813 /DNA_START=390 /DNA_END=1355 /DNA_ORIENTATION=+